MRQWKFATTIACGEYGTQGTPETCTAIHILEVFPAKLAKVAHPAPDVCPMPHVGRSTAGPFLQVFLKMNNAVLGLEGLLSWKVSGRCPAHVTKPGDIAPEA